MLLKIFTSPCDLNFIGPVYSFEKLKIALNDTHTWQNLAVNDPYNLELSTQIVWK